MERWSGKVAIVTGASAGIGKSIVYSLVQHNLKVVGVARRFERLEEIAKDVTRFSGKFYPFKADISKREDIEKLFEWVNKNLDGVDILINNAGIIRNTNLSEGDVNMWKEVFDTNVMGLCIASREAIKSMKARNVTEGQIIQVNSVAGHSVIPEFASSFNVYGASKHAVTALAKTLRLELNKLQLPIKVTSLSPGAVHTEIAEAANYDSSTFDISKMPFLDSEDVANAVVMILSVSPKCNISELTLQPVGEMF